MAKPGAGLWTPVYSRSKVGGHKTKAFFLSHHFETESEVSPERAFESVVTSRRWPTTRRGVRVHINLVVPGDASVTPWKCAESETAEQRGFRSGRPAFGNGAEQYVAIVSAVQLTSSVGLSPQTTHVLICPEMFRSSDHGQRGLVAHRWLTELTLRRFL
jgi:hypothetical protein